jgi:hypothetical protein
MPNLASSRLQRDALLSGAMYPSWASIRPVRDCRLTGWALRCRAVGASDLYAFIRGIHSRATA